MKITEEEVRHVAKLARLDLTDEEVTVFSRQVGDILDYVDQLNSVDTQGVEGTSHAISVNNAFREDKAVDSMDPDLALSNAPEREDTDIIVPKVL
ncbi:MAG: Asp-tRNA(Asn)/Glu-tRNA(Gln) amidotransferase subunit GatC [Desulfatibacillum sp.]|nr:Asp-tRNA(Asn)/Glu-tRNA(Gln) amidotransferase subunit GatC [Desulfatibacillum sp.]